MVASLASSHPSRLGARDRANNNDRIVGWENSQSHPGWVGEELNAIIEGEMSRDRRDGWRRRNTHHAELFVNVKDGAGLIVKVRHVTIRQIGKRMNKLVQRRDSRGVHIDREGATAGDRREMGRACA